MESLFQSTLPRGERPPDILIHSDDVGISIHAPARGATMSMNTNVQNNLISIHAPARGATDKEAQVTQTLWISIHAPARGATKSVSIRCTGYSKFQSTLPRGERRNGRGKHKYYRNFNPRSREGSDRKLEVCSAVKLKFQSTLPRGERQCCRCFSVAKR